MEETKTYTESEAERFFAIRFNGKTWQLLEKQGRSPDENEQMIDFAHASLAHWRVAGTPLHIQRGTWLLSHVYSLLGQDQTSLYYARRCQALTLQYIDLMQDFDRAYAYEAMARANTLAKNQVEAEQYRKLAEEAGASIQSEEDRKIFMGDLTRPNW